MKLYDALKLLRMAGITEMKCTLPELQAVDGPSDLHAVYEAKRHGIAFCVDSNGDVVAPDGLRQKLRAISI